MLVSKCYKPATRMVVSVPIVAHIVGTVFDPKTSCLGSLGVILAPLDTIWVTLGSPGDPKGSPMRKRETFGTFSPSIWDLILALFWTKFGI